MGLLVLAVPIALIGLVVSLLRRTVVTVEVDEHPGVAAIAAHTRGWRVVGLVTGAVAAFLLLALGERVDALGRLTALAPAALGAGVLLGTIFGELTARAPIGVRRSAAVETRRLAPLVPRTPAVVLGVGSTLLAGALALGAAWGSPDDLGRAGRSLAMTCTQLLPDLGVTTVGSAHGPWPGSFYAVPLSLALVALAGLVVVALRVIVRRPRPEVDSLALDTLLRRWSVRNVLTAATVAVLGTLGPVAVLMFGALTSMSCDLSAAQSVVMWVCLVVGPVATGATLAVLGALVLTPRIRVGGLHRPLPGEATPVRAPVR